MILISRFYRIATSADQESFHPRFSFVLFVCLFVSFAAVIVMLLLLLLLPSAGFFYQKIQEFKMTSG